MKLIIFKNISIDLEMLAWDRDDPRLYYSYKEKEFGCIFYKSRPIVGYVYGIVLSEDKFFEANSFEEAWKILADSLKQRINNEEFNNDL